MANIIIENRLNKLSERKHHLLTLKKKERGNGLKVVNEIISRLKRWQKDLDKKEQQKIIQKKEITQRKKKKATNIIDEAIKKTSNPWNRACRMINHQIEKEFANVSQLEDYEIEFIEALVKKGENDLKTLH